jgi:hypothetical protein
VKLHLEPLAGIRIGPLAVDALVLVIGPGILELVQLKALILETRDIGKNALGVASVLSRTCETASSGERFRN